MAHVTPPGVYGWRVGARTAATRLTRAFVQRFTRAQQCDGEVGVTTIQQDDADVVVVGAGPAGSTAAYYLAAAGLDVLVLEKSAFPREKVCGDGYTPRAVRELVAMGLPIRPEDGWIRNKGLRVYGGGHRLEIPWPQLDSFPDFGLARTRRDFDHALARHARAAGATILERTAVTGPVLHERTGRVVGVSARPVDDAGRRSGDEVTYRAPVVIAADGVSARMPSPSASRRTRPARWALRSAPTSAPRCTTTSGWSPTWSCGTGRPAGRTCCPAAAGSSRSATGRRTAGWAGGAHARWPPAWTARTGCDGWWPRPPRSGSSPPRARSGRCGGPPCRWPSTASRCTAGA